MIFNQSNAENSFNEAAIHDNGPSLDTDFSQLNTQIALNDFVLDGTLAEIFANVQDPLEMFNSSSPIGAEVLTQLKIIAEEHQRTKHDANHVLAPFKDIEDYLDNLVPVYQEKVKRIATVDLGPLAEPIQLTFCIPVAAIDECETIYRTLKCFTGQTADPETFEILLNINWPAETQTIGGHHPSIDKTFESISQFVTEHPEINLLVLIESIEQSGLTIGYLRRLVTDVTLARHLSRGGTERDHIVVRADSDIHGIHRNYVAKMIASFAAQPKVDAFKGKLDFALDHYALDPIVYFSHRFFQAFDQAIRIEFPNQLPCCGANLACRASAYARIGGYNTLTKVGEDLYFDKQLQLARQNSEEHIAIKYAGVDTAIFSSARRGIAAIAAGYSPMEQWSIAETEFGSSNQTIRTFSQAVVPEDYLSALEAADFPEKVQRQINRTLLLFSDSVDSSSLAEQEQNDAIYQKTIQRTLDWFGVTFNYISPQHIEVTDVDRLRNTLRAYLDNWASIQERITGLPI